MLEELKHLLFETKEENVSDSIPEESEKKQNKEHFEITYQTCWFCSWSSTKSELYWWVLQIQVWFKQG